MGNQIRRAMGTVYRMVSVLRATRVGLQSRRYLHGDFPAAMEEITKLCNCLPALEMQARTVQKEGPNKGRSFMTCPEQEGGCNFFEWQDNHRRHGSESASDATCACGSECNDMSLYGAK